MNQGIVIDKAGANGGGARRFLLELEAYLEAYPRNDLKLLGGSRLDSRWLIRREIKAMGYKRIALNNASFALPGEERIVLLRNALHFATQDEFRELGYVPSQRMRLQIPLIRALAHRADTIIVPCTAMAERVMKHAPKLAKKVEVRLHPVSARGWADQSPSEDEQIILVPIIPSSYKRLDVHIPSILEASAGTNALLVVTASPGEIPTADGHPRYLPIGRMPAEELAHWWRKSTAIFFPPTLESFGYALAEARTGGRPVIAPGTRQNREIAGEALCEYSNEKDLVDAIHNSLSKRVQPNPAPFDPIVYFDKLLS